MEAHNFIFKRLPYFLLSDDFCFAAQLHYSLFTEGTPSFPRCQLQEAGILLALTQARELTVSPFLHNVVHLKPKISNIYEENAGLEKVIYQAKGKGEQDN